MSKKTNEQAAAQAERLIKNLGEAAAKGADVVESLDIFRKCGLALVGELEKLIDENRRAELGGDTTADRDTSNFARAHVREPREKGRGALESANGSIADSSPVFDADSPRQKFRANSLGALSCGGRFTFGGYEWVKLDNITVTDGQGRDREAAVCLAADVIENHAFNTDERDEGGENNFKKSTLREYLNNNFLNGFITAATTNPADIARCANVPYGIDSLVLPLEIDLTADDGGTEYGVDKGLDAACALKIGLITCDQYRKYRRYIPDVNKYWWTATPWTCNSAYSYLVRNVHTSGALSNYNAFYGSCGLRPLLNLAAEILVSNGAGGNAGKEGDQ